MREARKKAVLFDLDGTLLDTVEDLADCMNTAVAEEGLPTTPVPEHCFMIGDGVLNYTLRALPAGLHQDAELIERVQDRYRHLCSQRWANKTRPYEGVVEMLDELARRGIPMAVLSNKPDGATRQAVGHFLPGLPFKVVRGAVDGVPLKPDPSAALAIAGEMGTPPEEFAYLGDTSTDMRTALAAGMFAVGALWGFRPRSELHAAGAQALIERPAELLQLV